MNEPSTSDAEHAVDTTRHASAAGDVDDVVEARAPRRGAPTDATDDPWAWAHETDDREAARLPGDRVVAVLVAHEAAEWLPRTLRAMSELSIRPGVIVGVDVASSDGTSQVLAQAVDEGVLDFVVQAEPLGLGQAVDRALAQVPEDHTWLWVLHDDSEPLPDALGALLSDCITEPEPAVLFPKLLGPRRRNHPDQLLEIGQSITDGGRRALSVEPGDIDQHQQDASITLGGSSAGMFVRRDAWTTLGGFDPDLPLFRDAVDFGWRANDAGLVVRTVPEAALRHHQRGRWGDRQSSLAPDLVALDRQLGMRLSAARSPRPGLARVRLWAGSLLAALVLLIGKNPAEARAAWRAGWATLRDGAAIGRVRERASQVSAQPTLRPRRVERVGHVIGTGVGAFTDRYRDLRDDSSDTSLDDLIGDDYSGGRTRARLLAPTTAVLLAVVALCVVAARRLLGPGALTSIHLPAAPASLQAAFDAWLHPAAGHAGSNAPWLGLTAIGSFVAGGQPEVLVRLVVLGAPIWAALACLSLVRVVLGRGADGWLVGLLAASWGLVVAVLGLPARGSVTAIAAAVLLPLAVSAGLRWWRQDRDDSHLEISGGDLWRAPGLLALWLGLLGTAQPLFWVVALLVAAAHVVSTRRLSARSAVVALGPFALSAPWWVRLADAPGRLLTGADPTAAAAEAAPRPLALLFGRLGDGTGPQAASLIVFALLWVIALLVAFVAARRQKWWGLALVATAVAAIAVAGLVSRAVVTIDGAQVRPAADTFVVIGALALLCALIAAASTVTSTRARSALTAVVVAVTLASATGWQWVSTTGPAGVSASQVPAHVHAVQDSARASRALLIEVSPQGTGWSLTSSTSPQWGSGELHPGGGSQLWNDQVAPLVAQITLANPPDDLAARLQTLGISHVWISHPTPTQVNALTNTDGLVASPVNATARVWTVAGLVGRAQVQPASGDPVAMPEGQVPAGASRVVIAEQPDDRWRVTINGERVAVTGGQAPIGIDVAPGGRTGLLAWSTAPSVFSVLWEGLVLLVLVVLAAPTLGRQRLTDDGARFEQETS